jgi:hypothetical protein
MRAVLNETSQFAERHRLDLDMQNCVYGKSDWKYLSLNYTEKIGFESLVLTLFPDLESSASLVLDPLVSERRQSLR